MMGVVLQLAGKVAEWLRRFIQEHPFSFIVVVLGALLLLAGFDQGVPYLKVSDSLRPAAIVLGILFVAMAAVLYVLRDLRSPDSQVSKLPNRIDSISVDGDASQFTAGEREILQAVRATELTATQKQVLHQIDLDTDGRSVVPQAQLAKALKMDPTELYYRLEQLRLLRLVDQEVLSRGQNPEYGYRFSQAEARRRGVDRSSGRPSSARPQPPGRPRGVQWLGRAAPPTKEQTKPGTKPKPPHQHRNRPDP